MSLPGHDNEKVQAVPGLWQIASSSSHAHREHLDAHFHRKIQIDYIVTNLMGESKSKNFQSMKAPSPPYVLKTSFPMISSCSTQKQANTL